MTGTTATATGDDAAGGADHDFVVFKGLDDGRGVGVHFGRKDMPHPSTNGCVWDGCTTGERPYPWDIGMLEFDLRLQIHSAIVSRLPHHCHTRFILQ
jgi:hypothetical protein